MFVRMVFHGIVRTLWWVVAVLPRTIRQVEISYCRDDLFAERRVPGFVVRVPNDDARVIPVVSHPFAVFTDHLIGIKVDLVLRAVPVMASPYKIFVLY